MTVSVRIGVTLGQFDRAGQKARAIYLSPEDALEWLKEEGRKLPVIGTAGGVEVRLGRRSEIYNTSGVARAVRRGR